MSRLDRETLIAGVQQELITYLQNGYLNERSVARSLDITGLDIADLDRLKRIHFCLSDAVVEFVESLRPRLRRIKTANQREREITRGEVRGSIDWQATTRLRYTEAAGDRTQFACKTPYTEYDIAENLVLKKLLWVIHSTVQRDISVIDYDWRTEVWPARQITMFSNIYGRNVHLNRIREGEEITVTRRMLNTARSARQSLYSDAYTLYDRYLRLLEGAYDDQDISELLSDTLVVPERLPRLFELFCVFRLLRVLDGTGLTLQPIEPGSNQLATAEDERVKVDVYHDRGGGLSFHVPFSELDEGESEYFRKYRHAKRRHEQLIEAFLGGDTRPSLFGGRPDLVLEVYDRESREVPTDVVLGEIKYSDRKQTFGRGLEELLKYMEFAQKDGYLYDQDVNIRGLIITDGVDTEVDTAPDGDVTHLTAESLASELSHDDALFEGFLGGLGPFSRGCEAWIHR